MAKLRLASEQVYRGHDPDDEHDRAERHPETQPFLDDGARLRPVAVEQKSQQIEADAATMKEPSRCRQAPNLNRNLTAK